jgi:hypothetical protein
MDDRMTQKTLVSAQATKAAIVGGPPRSMPIALTWPVACDGKTYDTVVVRRLSTREVADFITAVSEDPGARLPLFCDVDGHEIPKAVFEAMDRDDTDALNEAAEDFLPRVLRQTADAPTPQTGEPSPE